MPTKKAAKSLKRHGFLWITDPWETLDHARDTTLRLVQEAQALGLQNHWCDVKSIRWDQDQVLLDARRIESIGASRESPGITLGPVETFSPLSFQSLQYRTDPPVDLAYQHPLQLLHLSLETEPLTRKRPQLVNPISALLLANEKLEAGILGGLLPPTVVSCQWGPLERFGLSEKKTVLKPLHLAQSIGVELLAWDSPRERARSREIIEEATVRFERPVLLQRYLPGIATGETRLWFLDGKLLAFARKLPLENDFRVNIDRGSRLAPHRVTAKERNISTRIGKRLRQLRVRLAAVDLIEDYVTDFNFTSPGLITQMEAVTERNLARPIVRALARHIR